MTIKTENWLGEYTSTIGTGDVILGGAIDGFADFSNVGENIDVYYTIMDALDKETGIGTLTGGKLVRKDIHATLVAGVYVKNGSAINLSGDAQVYGTANAKFLDYVQGIGDANAQNTQAIASLLAVTICGHALAGAILLNAGDVGARPDNWMPTASDVGAYSKVEADTKFLNAQDAEQSAGKVMRVGGTRDQQLQQSINDIAVTFIGVTPPVGAPDGKRWFDSSSGRTFILYRDVDSVQWIEESPSGAPVVVPSDRPVLCLDFVEDRNYMWKGYQPRDGQLLNRSDYPEAWGSIQAGLVPKCTDAEWLSTPTKRGCYTEGNGTTTFRMPDYNGKYAGSLGAVFIRGDGLNSAGFAGGIQGDVMRNIKGSTFNSTLNIGSADIPADGPWAAVSNLHGASLSTAQSNYAVKYYSPKLDFDASRQVPTGPEFRPVAASGCWVSKMFGALQTNLPLISISQIAALEARIAVLEANP